MELALGYGLEISFLINALFRPGMHTGRIVNAHTLPHAHLPKDEGDIFAMGVEMFTLVLRRRRWTMTGDQSRRRPKSGSCPRAEAAGPVRPALTYRHRRWTACARTES